MAIFLISILFINNYFLSTKTRYHKKNKKANPLTFSIFNDKIFRTLISSLKYYKQTTLNKKGGFMSEKSAKEGDTEDYLAQIVAGLSNKVSASKEVKNGELKTDVPGYLKLLSKFLRILKENDIPVILKKEKGEDSFLCHKFQETNIKATSYKYATTEFREIYNFVPYLSELSQLKTKVSFDGYLIEVHLSRNEWWLYKKKRGKIITEQMIEIPRFSEFLGKKRVIKVKDISFQQPVSPTVPSQRNIQKEIINLSEKCFKILEENWKGEEKIASLSVDFAVDANDKPLIYDFDVCLIRIDDKRKEEIRISRQEAISKMQLSVNNTLILNIANLAKPPSKQKERKKRKNRR